jgi:hypothetical protein
MVRPLTIIVKPVLTNSTPRTRSSNSSIRVVRLRCIRDGKEAVRLASTIGTKMEELTNQGIPTSRQEEEVNGNSRKGEPGVSGKEGDYIVDGQGRGIGCTSLAGHAALRQDCGLGERLMSDFPELEWSIVSLSYRSFYGLVKEPRPDGESCLEDSPDFGTTD